MNQMALAAAHAAALADGSSAKFYRGFRADDGALITVVTAEGEKPLPLHTDLLNHSPDGFEWGYGGSGPAQAAFAILVDAVGPERAFRRHQEFKDRVLSAAPREWTLSLEDVRAVLSEIESETA